jgi:fatty acyl-CoA reductase
MAERTLKKVYGKLKCAIVRPSIIICSAKEPLVGWTDTMSAGGGIAMGVALGLMRVV